MQKDLTIVMLGATGAVGSHVATTLLSQPRLLRLSLLGRRALKGACGPALVQHRVDIFDVDSYATQLAGHAVAICTLGVGQPSKLSKEDFVRIDKLAVLDFAKACKNAGVRHFQLLGSLGADSSSKSFYLRSKGELEDELRALGFERLSLFQPSMILTPKNRYGAAQALTLKVWPLLRPVLVGPLRNLRGIKVENLGRAIALNTLRAHAGEEVLHWDDFRLLVKRP